jgi:endonuclease G
MVAQQPAMNRGVWSRVEQSIRRLVLQEGELYVTTGPLFLSQSLKTIGPDRVIVPTHMFKVVYDPRAKVAFAIVVENINTNVYSIKTVHELEAMSGIKYPGIPEALKDQKIGGLNGV